MSFFISSLNLVSIAGGPVVIGSPAFYDAPPRWVSLSPFLVGETPVTKREFDSVMGGIPFNLSGLEGDHPINFVTWRDTYDFFFRHNFVLRDGAEASRRPFSLPTEAEMETAIRGPAVNLQEEMEREGVRASEREDWLAHFAGDRFENFVTSLEVGQIIFNDPRERYLLDRLRKGLPLFAWRVYGTISGQLPPFQEESVDPEKPAIWGPKNASGLYGIMRGIEWVADRYDQDAYSWLPTSDPINLANGTHRVVRGGAFHREGTPYRNRAAIRMKYPENEGSRDIRFRVRIPD